MSKPFSHRVGNLELQACDRGLGLSEPYTTLQILHHEEEIPLTIAYWEYSPSTEKWDIRFVDHRPFRKAVDPQVFWNLLREGQKRLEQTLKTQIG